MWKKLLGSLRESVDEELWLRHAYLATENRILYEMARCDIDHGLVQC
jgi:hypothetical protein